MNKRAYRATSVNDVNVGQLSSAVGPMRVVIGIDVAKSDFKAAVMNGEREVLITIKWKHPKQTQSLLELAESLRDSGAQVEVVMEPTGNYGSALAEQMNTAGFGVFMVSTKRVHDMAEVYDGVPSKHDGKDAAIIARLHWEKASRPWPFKSPERRELSAQIRTVSLFHEGTQRAVNQLEGRLAEYWPGITELLGLQSATLWSLLLEFGSPQRVAAAADQARGLMRRTGGHFLKPDKIESVLESAHKVQAYEPVGSEVIELQTLVGELRRNHELYSQSKRALLEACERNESARRMAEIVGPTAATAIVAMVGDPQTFLAAMTFVKAMGLNLAEHSSGKHQGRLKLTKRGSSTARKYLFLATLRLLQTDPVLKAWYLKKVKRDGGKVKLKAVIAVMRKVAAALWYVARGERFNARKLFDARRLGLEYEPDATTRMQAGEHTTDGLQRVA